jgi:hypothetical protein
LSISHDGTADKGLQGPAIEEGRGETLMIGRW